MAGRRSDVHNSLEGHIGLVLDHRFLSVMASTSSLAGHDFVMADYKEHKIWPIGYVRSLCNISYVNMVCDMFKCFTITNNNYLSLTIESWL